MLSHMLIALAARIANVCIASAYTHVIMQGVTDHSADDFPADLILYVILFLHTSVAPLDIL